MKLINDWMQHTEQRLKLMGRMAERLEVDSSEVFGGLMGTRFRAMLGRCRSCQQAQVCQRWLDGEDVGQDHTGFCPNAATFEPHRPVNRETPRPN